MKVSKPLMAVVIGGVIAITGSLMNINSMVGKTIVPQVGMVLILVGCIIMGYGLGITRTHKNEQNTTHA